MINLAPYDKSDDRPERANGDVQSGQNGTLLPKARVAAVDPYAAAIARLGYTFCRSNVVLPVSLVGSRLVVKHTEDTERARRRIRRHADIHDVVIHKTDPGVLMTEIRSKLPPEPDTQFLRIQALINEAFIRGANLNSSDVMWEPELDCAHLRFDCQGIFRHEATITNEEYEAVLSLLGPRTFTAYNPRVGQKGSYLFKEDGRSLNLRGTSWPRWLMGETKPKLVYRVLQPYYLLRQINELGMSPEQQTRLLNVLRAGKCGLVVAAPPGQGKTSTIFAGLQALNAAGCNIYSIEEPPEIYAPFIWTTELHDAWTHEQAISLTNRLTPTFIFIGETLDEKSAILTLNSLLGSVPSATTVHASCGVEAIDRLLSLKVERDRVERGVTAFAAQRLLNPLCRCASDNWIDTPDAVREIFARLKMPAPEQIRRRKVTLDGEQYGCDECFGHGIVRPRQAVFELILMNPSIRAAIRGNASPDEIANLAYNKDNLPMIAYACKMLVNGLIDDIEFVKVPLPYGDSSNWI